MNVAPSQAVAALGLSQVVAVPGRFSHADRQAILSWPKWRSRNFRAIIRTSHAGLDEVAEVWRRRPLSLPYRLSATATGVSLEIIEEGWNSDFATAAAALTYLLAHEA